MRKFLTRFTLVLPLLACSAGRASANDSDNVNCNDAWSVKVIGSSTSYVTGASAYDISWVVKITAYLKRKNSQSIVYNFGIPGYTSYQNHVRQVIHNQPTVKYRFVWQRGEGNIPPSIAAEKVAEPILSTGPHVKVLSNPTYNFKLVITSHDKKTPIYLRLTNISSKMIERKNNITAGQTITIGSNYMKEFTLENSSRATITRPSN